MYKPFRFRNRESDREESTEKVISFFLSSMEEWVKFFACGILSLPIVIVVNHRGNNNDDGDVEHFECESVFHCSDFHSPRFCSPLRSARVTTVFFFCSAFSSIKSNERRIDSTKKLINSIWVCLCEVRVCVWVSKFAVRILYVGRIMHWALCVAQISNVGSNVNHAPILNVFILME